MLKLEPIKLLRGSHPDIGTTGRGCVMNVIAYLNGEAQITGQSPCVCFVAWPILIWLNDALRDTERHRMIPYIERAMGSRSDDPAVFVPRARAAARFAVVCAKWAAESAAKAARLAAESAVAESAESAKWAAKWAAESAAKAARWAAESAAAESAESAESARWAIIEAAFALLDEALPPAPDTQPAVVIERAQKLLALV